MSLFGNKPATTQSSGFGFSAAPTTSTSLFGTSSTANKPQLGSATTSSAPLFGSTTNTTTSGSLFGSSGSTTTAPLFGSATTSTAKPLFGATTTTTAGSLFGSTPASGQLFGSTSTTTSTLFPPKTTGSILGTTNTAPLFGTATSGSLFSGSTTAPTFSSTGGLFGSKSSGTGFSFPSTTSKPANLFGPTPASQSSISTVQDVIQNSEFLVRSLTAPELYGDERDTVIMKVNQLLAACGVGSGYFKGDKQSVQYDINGPFYCFKAIGYNRRSEYRESDGIVALTLDVNYDQFSTNAQRQKLIDALNVIVGNKPNIKTHIESIRPLDNATEILIYVTEKGKGRISSKELCDYLKQPTQEGQLKSQLCVTDVVSRSSMDDSKLQVFLETPPRGFDFQVWKQAIRENPNPKHLIPYPIRGFDQLRKRQKLQIGEVSLVEKALDGLKHRLIAVGNEIANGDNRYSVCRQKQKELSYRLLRCLVMQTLVQRYSVAVDVREERLESRLEALNAALVAPNQVKSRISNLLTFLRSNSEVLKLHQESTISLKDVETAQIRKYLSRCQQALEAIVSVVNRNLDDLKIMSAQF
uniref:Nup54 domain-containing protein n=1 Tax=Syphacia muris TaxID=451379 RepID=A0A0N5AFT9_9BILA